MDNLKRIKACLLLSTMLPVLSSCSSNDIKYNNYKIMQEYNLEMDDYYLVKVDKINNKKLEVIGKFDTIEEAKEYLDSIMLLEEDNTKKNYIFSGVSILIIGGFMYLCIKNQKKDEKEKVLKK